MEYIKIGAISFICGCTIAIAAHLAGPEFIDSIIDIIVFRIGA